MNSSIIRSNTNATTAQTAPIAIAMAEIPTSRNSAVKSPLSLTTRSMPAPLL